VFRRFAVPWALAAGAVAAPWVAMPQAHALTLSPCLPVSADAADGCRITDSTTGNGWIINTVTGEFGGGGIRGIDLKSMPWWSGTFRDSTIAEQFATAVSTFFGYPNYEGSIGPLFAASEIGNVSRNATIEQGSGPDAQLFDVIRFDSFTYAYAVPSNSNPAVPEVPGPVPLLGAAAAFGYSRKLRNRIKAR
jgi:hypothetical protein